MPSDLGNWEDGAASPGWEEELTMDECRIVQDYRIAVKEEQRHERQCKIQAQKDLRKQKKHLHPCLGVKEC